VTFFSRISQDFSYVRKISHAIKRSLIKKKFSRRIRLRKANNKYRFTIFIIILFANFLIALSNLKTFFLFILIKLDVKTILIKDYMRI